MENWILRLSLVDQPDQPILMRASRKEGGHSLDLDLLATDGDNAWRAKVRERKLEKLRSSSYDGSPEEWSVILQYALVTRHDAPLPAPLRDNFELVCNTNEKGMGSVLSITFRTRVEDITHKLGAVDLQYSDNTDDVDLFGWASQVAEKRDAFADELEDCKDRIQKAENTIKSLEKQLQDLITAKEEHETQLLSKFTVLLNEKKLRIRAQQRQIAEQDDPAKGNHSTTEAKNPRKRKTNGRQTTASAESDESEGFEAMNADPPADVETDIEPYQTTSDESGKEDAAQVVLKQKQKLAGPTKGRQDFSATPPPRDLPFANQTKPSKAAPQRDQSDTAMEDDEATASEEDDEL